MANLFVKKGQLKTVNGGYLVVNNEAETPVYHQEFVALQQEAHALVKLAEKVKETDFTKKKVVTFEDLRAEVEKELKSKKVVSYVPMPEKVEQPLTTKLKDEAMLWLNFQQNETKAAKINSIMSKFDLINDFCSHGLYFTTDKIVKLEAIYTIEQIVEAVSVLEPHLA